MAQRRSSPPPWHQEAALGPSQLLEPWMGYVQLVRESEGEVPRQVMNFSIEQKHFHGAASEFRLNDKIPDKVHVIRR